MLRVDTNFFFSSYDLPVSFKLIKIYYLTIITVKFYSTEYEVDTPSKENIFYNLNLLELTVWFRKKFDVESLLIFLQLAMFIVRNFWDPY